jgi:hypothetical protein
MRTGSYSSGRRSHHYSRTLPTYKRPPSRKPTETKTMKTTRSNKNRNPHKASSRRSPVSNRGKSPDRLSAKDAADLLHPDKDKRNLPDSWKGNLVTADLAALKPSDLDEDGDPLDAEFVQDGVSVTLTIARSHESFCTSLTAYRWDGKDWECVANDSEAGTETDDPISELLESLDRVVADEDDLLCSANDDWPEDPDEEAAHLADFKTVIAICREAAACFRRANGLQ